jgi:hypothetical protein
MTRSCRGICNGASRTNDEALMGDEDSVSSHGLVCRSRLRVSDDARRVSSYGRAEGDGWVSACQSD